MSSRDATGDPAGEIGHLVPDVETLAQRLAGVDYLVDEGLATSLFLSLRLPQPLLLEGEAGVGKTEAGKSLAAVLDTPLIRLQCYDGIDAAEALYEWNYPRQLLSIRLADASGTQISEEELFGADYLIRRPLLRALEHPGPRPAVLLIDEIDRADDDFEAFLLELLADAAVTIPEIGTVRATHPPVIVLTSNRTRDLHDAVKRRCLYHWIDYPTPEREVEIVRRRVKGAPEALAVQVAGRGGAHPRERRAEAARRGGGDRLGGRARSARRGGAGRGGRRPDAGIGPQVQRGPGGGPRRRPGAARHAMTGPAFTVRTLHLDLPGVAAAFGRRLHEAGVDTTADRAVRFARALELGRPVSRGRLYWIARGVFVTDRAQVRAFDAVFAEVFGARERPAGAGPDEEETTVPARERAAGRSRDERGIAGVGRPHRRTAG